MNNSTGRSSGLGGLIFFSQGSASSLVARGLLVALLLSFIFLALYTLLLYFPLFQKPMFLIWYTAEPY